MRLQNTEVTIIDNIKGYGKVSIITNPLEYKTNQPYYSLSIKNIRERNNRGNRRRTKNNTQIIQHPNNTHYKVDNFVKYISGNEANMNMNVAELHYKIKMLKNNN